MSIGSFSDRKWIRTKKDAEQKGAAGQLDAAEQKGAAEQGDTAEQKGAAEQVSTVEKGNTVTDGMTESRAAAVPEGNAAKESEMTESTNDLFSGMQQLEEEQHRSRREEESSEDSTRCDEPYQYFKPDCFDETVYISPSVRRAKKRVMEEERQLRPHISFGYARGYNYHMDSDISGTIFASGTARYWQTSLHFDRDSVVSASCSFWKCNCGGYHDSRVVLCEHGALLLDYLKEELKKENQADATNLQALHLLRKVGAARPVQDEQEEGEKQAGQMLMLRPYAVLSDETDGADKLQFRIGASKLYKIKNLSQFVEKTDNNEEVVFGSKTTLRLGEQYLDEEGRQWLDLIRSIDRETKDTLDQVESYNSDYRHYDRIPESVFKLKDHVKLSGSKLDRFFELALGKNYEFQLTYEDGKKAKKLLRITGGEFRPSLTVSPLRGMDETFEGVMLTGRMPLLRFGQQNVYFVEGDCFKGAALGAGSLLQELMDSCDVEGFLDMHIGRRNLQAFYNNLLPRLRELADVNVQEEAYIRSYLYPEAEITTYLDADSRQLKARGEVRYGAHTHDAAEAIRQQYVHYERFKDAKYMPEFVPKLENYRDKAAESSYLDTLEKYFEGYDYAENLFIADKTDETLFRLLDQGLPALQKLGEVRVTDRFRRLRIKKVPSFALGVSVSRDSLLDLTIQSDDLTTEEIEQILSAYKQHQSFYRLRDGSFLKLSEEDGLARLREMMEAMHVRVQDFVKGKMQIPMYRALYLEQMLENTADLYADRDRRFKSLIKEFKTVDDSDFEVPGGLSGQLRRYQLTGYRWLRTLDSHGFGGILADEMGLGKTLQVIAVLQALKEEGLTQGQPSLIVCPASLVYNWGEELKRFAPSLRVCLIAGTQGERKKVLEKSDAYDVLVTSYDLLKRDIDQYEEKQFRLQVIDEAQYIKNANTAQAKTVKLIHAKTKFALTGTPIENRLSELWSIFDYLMPGFLYSYEEFRTQLETPIVKMQDAGASERLSRMIGSFVLRRLKKEVLKDLPDKLEENRYAVMEKKQRKLYDAQAMKLMKELRSQTGEEFQKNRMQVLAEITKLRQICCDPSLLYEDYTGGSAKTESMLELIETLTDGGHKTLVFSQFVSMLQILEQALIRKKIPYYMITGSTSKEKRMEYVNAFNEDEVPVFLISLKAGGTGLNLTGADVVVHYDPWWNAAAQNQATDRAHRIGQTKVVNVYKLIMKDTIEEKIVKMQEDKIRLAEEVLGGEQFSSGAISREDLLAILET